MTESSGNLRAARAARDVAGILRRRAAALVIPAASPHNCVAFAKRGELDGVT